MSAPRSGERDTLRDGFLRSASRFPMNDALRVAGRRIAYGDAEERARRWARALVNGDRPAARVGVFGYRSEISYLGALASLFAGAAFVPLNPRYPAARTAYMARHARLDAVIADDEGVARLCDVVDEASGLRVLTPGAPASDVASAGVDVVDRRALARCRPLDELPPAGPDDVAYLMYTSGSTGSPKGVPIRHRNVAPFLRFNRARYALGPEDRLTQTFDQTFDLSVFDLFVAWDAGACVCVPSPRELLAPTGFVEEHGITMWFSVPSLAALLVRRGLLHPRSFPSLRWSLFCGEALPVEIAEAWRAAAPGAVLENLYGPTEATIACFVHRWDDERSPAAAANGLVPIGRPYEGVDAIVDGDDGVTGELCLAGPQVFSGYWRDDDATARTTFAPRPGGPRFYRTGDRVVRSPDGELSFLGRLDAQVKVLGHRVELGEVEAMLRSAGAPQAAVVALPPGAPTATELVAYVAGDGVDAVALRDAAAARLPAYMVPSTIEVVSDMPLNANGKIDRRALAARGRP